MMKSENNHDSTADCTSGKYFENPILPGFYPDPSICRVGEDYYLVTSSFSYFPGIPIFHSRDLINWKQIGHVLDRPSQLDLDDGGHSAGIYAPTIRYHQGKFFVITTNVTRGGNFIVTADNPSGPWSDPYWLNDAPGIDPSLFFDDDGKAYYVGTSEAPEGGKYFGDNEIWLQELDLNTMTLTGQRYGLWRGALKNAIWPEGPHIYKINGMYYLLIAEGGTDYHHSVTIARSRQLTGPYEGNPGNPILTHRHLGRAYPIANTGHADLIETQNGEWWMVALASRPYGGYFRNLGRETFMAPVEWEDGWPVVSPGTGKLEFKYLRPELPQDPEIVPQVRDDFDSAEFELVWNVLRTPREQFWSLTDRPGYLRLRLIPEKLTELSNPSFICRRQQHMNFSAAACMEFRPVEDNEAAGIALIQSNDFNLRMEYTWAAGQNEVRLIRCFNGEETILARQELAGPKVYMKVTAEGQDYSFYLGNTENDMKPLAEKVDGRLLSTDVAGGFVGTYIGMYASSNGKGSSNHADFDWFEYKQC